MEISTKTLKDCTRSIGIAANHLGCILPAEHPPYTADPSDVLKEWGPGDAYDNWVAWRLCYNVHQTLLSVFKQDLSTGLRALAYDSQDFIDDKETPYEVLLRPCTVTDFYFDEYGRLIADVLFDYGRKSSTFAEGLRSIRAKVVSND